MRVLCGLDAMIAKIARGDHLNGVAVTGLGKLGGKGLHKSHAQGAGGRILSHGIERQYGQDPLPIRRCLWPPALDQVAYGKSREQNSKNQRYPSTPSRPLNPLYLSEAKSGRGQFVSRENP